jgi:DNA-binding winged helix-turn-helix (wHTH) protein/tetratricopeptide (TPR) repeat protein
MLSRRYRFEGFELDVPLCELRRDGEVIPLPLKSFDCIVYLLEKRERVVGRDELISAVWGRVDVNDALLGQTLARARRALGDTGGTQRMIRTMPRFGYRWVAPVALATADDPSEAVSAVGVQPADASAHAAASVVAQARSSAADPPRGEQHARRRRLAAALALVAVLAGAWIAFKRSAIDPPPRPSAADMYLVLPVAVRDADPQSRWIRLGAMDYLASAVRERGRLPVLPSEQTIAYLASHGETELADPAQRLGLAQRAGATAVLAAAARRDANGWSFTVDVQDAERTRHYEATAATPLQAADLALGQFFSQIGRAAEPAATPRPTLVELQQRIDAAFLDGDLQEAAGVIEGAPLELQRDPTIAVRSAEVDERAGRTDLAEADFRRIADAAVDIPVSIRSRAQYGLCAIDYRRYKLESAAGHCTDALKAVDGEDDPMLLGRIHMLRAVIAGERGDDEAAMAGFGLARLQWQRAGNLPGEASVDGNIGMAETRRSRFAEAVAAFDRAIAVFERFGVTDHLADALAAKADAQRQMLDIDGALASSAQAWQLTARIENAMTVRAVGYSRALALLAGGRFDEAAHVVERFDAAALSAPPEFAVLRRRLLAEQGHWAEAIEKADAIVDAVLAPSDPTSDASLSEAVEVLADAALHAGDAALASHLLSRLRDAPASPYDPDRAFVASLVQARLSVAAGDEASADVQFAAAVDTAVRDNRPDLIATAASDYVLFLLRRQRSEDATRVAGHLSLYAGKDYRAARAMTALYERLGDRRSADIARAQTVRLAGQRVADTGAVH